MLNTKLLQNKKIAVLWLSQLLSAIGDQIYFICACWLSAQTSPGALALIVGCDYVSAFLFSFVAGYFTDRYDRKKLMVAADLVRALALFSLSFASSINSVSIWHLALVGSCLGIFTALFDPSLVATIPSLTHGNHLLQDINGLIDFAKRLARALGPALAGLLGTVIPIGYLFNLDALTFLISAVGITYIGRRVALSYESPRLWGTSSGFLSDLISAVQLIRAHTFLAWELCCYFFANFAYAITYTVGLPLLAKQKFGGSVAAYGLLISIYGIASIIANLFTNARRIRNPGLIVSVAYLCWGIGFVLPSFAPNIVLACLALSVAAISSPIIFVTIVTTIQTDISNFDIGKVYSFRTAAMYSGLGLGLLVSSYLYVKWNATQVIPWVSCIYFVMGISGILRFYGKKQPAQINAIY